MSILVVSSRLSLVRRVALAGLVSIEGEPTIIDAADFGPRALTPEVTAVVLDGPCSQIANGLGATAEAAGLALVGIGVGMFGLELGPAVPTGEVMVESDDPSHPLVARLDTEFAIVDSFTPLIAPAAVGATLVSTLLSVNHRFVRRPAVMAGRHGNCRFVVSGLGHLDAALCTPALAHLLRRAMRGDLPDGRGRTLGLGVVGYGRYGGMGMVHGTAAAAVEGLAFVATCDRDPERRKAAEQDFAGVRVHVTLEDLAADDEVDIAVVATPPVSHTEDVIKLLRAGKHVACEKPLCLTAADADRLTVEARTAGRVLTVNQNRRWDRDFVAVRRAVEAGLVGEVFNVETFVGGFEHPCRAWHSEESISGGMVYDWGSHHIDWILQLLGSTPTVVSANGHKRVWHDVTNHDQIRVRMGWADGREAEFVCSDVAALRPPKLYVQGTAGTIAGAYRPMRFERIDAARGYQLDEAHHAEAPADLRLVRHQSGVGLLETVLPPAHESPYGFHRNLADHLLLGDPLAVSVASVREAVAVLEAATASAAQGGCLLAPAPPPAGSPT